MQFNNSMKMLLKKHLIEDVEIIPQNKKYPICEKEDTGGRKYWGVSSFWGLDKHRISSDQDLSQLEWDGNEVYFDARTEEEVPKILKKRSVY